MLETLPWQIENLTALTELRVNLNLLAELPDCIGKLSQLQTFAIFGNKLKSLPDSIGNLSRLEYLSLNRNQLEELPDTIGGKSSGGKCVCGGGGVMGGCEGRMPCLYGFLPSKRTPGDCITRRVDPFFR